MQQNETWLDAELRVMREWRALALLELAIIAVAVGVWIVARGGA
jgi:hypothetical protein